MERLSILRTARYRNGRFEVDGAVRATGTGDVDTDLTAAWATLGTNYDRFHRTDRLARLVLLCAEALLAVRDGAMYGTVEQFPGGQSRTALQTIVNFIVSGAAPASDVVLLSPKLITTENFDEAERLSEIPE